LGLDTASALPPPRPDDPPEPETSVEPPPLPRPPAPQPVRPRPERRKPDLAALPPLTTDDPPLWRRHLHWLLVLAMIPLAASLLAPSEETELLSRISDTLRSAPPDVNARFVSAIENEPTLDDILGILPGQRLKGAWL